MPTRRSETFDRLDTVTLPFVVLPVREAVTRRNESACGPVAVAALEIVIAVADVRPVTIVLAGMFVPITTIPWVTDAVTFVSAVEVAVSPAAAAVAAGATKDIALVG